MGKRCRVKRVPEKGDLDALETSRPVLVVSEDAQIEDIVVPPFRRAGLRTDKVGSGEAALAAVERRRPALILIDLKLEDMTGYELCHELKQRFDGVSIILMSDDRTEPHDRVAGLLLGADDYLPKPFHPSELLARARRLLPGSTGNGVSNDFGLTPRQLEVLRLLGQGLGREAVARELFVSPKPWPPMSRTS